MPNCVPQTTTPEALEDKFFRARQHSRVNYSFFYVNTNDNADTFSQLTERASLVSNSLYGFVDGNMLVDRQQALERICKTCRLPLMAYR